VQKLISLAGDETASPLVRAEASGALRNLAAMLKASATPDTYRRAMQDDIERFLNRPDPVRPPSRPLPSPPGDPIGSRQ
jgi:hypothetical protein